MNICDGCGHLFDDGEERSVTVVPGLVEKVCPICGDSYGPARYCAGCGKPFPESELFEDWCSSCLRDTVTYETALDYLQSEEIQGVPLLLDFMFSVFYQQTVKFGYAISDKLMYACRERFLRQRNDDLLCGKSEFLNMVRDYILEDHTNKTYYAEWLYDRRH